MSDLVFRSLPYTDPVVQRLLEEIYLDQTERYGGPDAAAVDPAEFAPPRGDFLTAWQYGEPVGCAGWRSDGDNDAELKRMYTVPAVRGRGVAIALLAAVEDSARAAGRIRLILNTGPKQPEAIALYEKCGYDPIEPYGHYKDYAEAVFLGRVL
ncbi:N-acetyltransferase [Longispora fulva]|uniref:GNAT superfamily N-acetyltransferase n=1 Tax=Longispora fulva TaxID=619741 RepID=A0A8J7KTS3_9ACTN|nr:GNAT family N-acetyltransferase [Longispora fulva]MBG6141057.1 GNAT superfamily N-acetyltransferase [Longispora fulva]GIG60673.1 N-acetyltransferase [Longispora fulva]